MDNIFTNFLLVAGILLFLLILVSSIGYAGKHPQPMDYEDEGQGKETAEPVAVRRERVKPVVETETQPRRRPGRPRKYTVH